MTGYRIAPERSQVWIEARSSLHPIDGTAAGLTGLIEVELDGDGIDMSAAPRASVELPVDRLRSGNPLYDREMQRRVEASRYPTITGRATGFQPSRSGYGAYTVSGELTFHGVTRRIAAEGRLTRLDDHTLVVEGEHVFDVRDYGITPPKILMLRVYPEVRVRVRVVAERQQESTGGA